MLATTGNCGRYKLTEDIVGKDFFDAFTFQAIKDPSGGRVNYVDQTTALSQNLTYASHDAFVLRADYTTTLDPTGAGRNSFRIRSNKEYKDGVMVFNMRHMPQGCATWPAVRTLGTHWPTSGGLIDMLEGVNDLTPDLITLHTGPNCTVPAVRDQTGTTEGTNCDVAETNNSGCGVSITDERSYGPQFNENGGGWYAMERSKSGIKIWFWPRASHHIPHEITSKHHVERVDTSQWGRPTAYFPSTTCDIDEHFDPQSIVINLTLCGGWAGSQETYEGAGCPGTCIDYVNNNPAAFEKAFFDFAWLRIYGEAF
jgi:hypothetical protein